MKGVMKGHHKIVSEERDKIAWWYAIGISVREIARRLGRSPSSISSEVKRNRIDGIYHSIHAHRASEERKRNCHKKYLLKINPILKSYMLDKLNYGWSPEQITGRLKKEIQEGLRPNTDYINHESIYQFIYDAEQREMRLWEKLPRRHKKRRRWLGRKSQTIKIPHRVSIRYRPDSINNRQEFGHWEGDTVVGDKHRTGIHTEVERVSRLLFAYQIPRVRAHETWLAQLAIFAPLPKQARKSTTLDNGVENYLHLKLQKELEMRTYFAHPYCSWQRGTNEYTNGLLRRYFPKGTDFRFVPQEAITAAVERLNNTPRKVLGYRTPREVFSAELHNSLESYRRTLLSTLAPSPSAQEAAGAFVRAPVA
jgi:IS30 family transposase